MTEHSTLDERVKLFRALELPGQPQMMHMGTSYLVDDLWREVLRLRGEINELRDEAFRNDGVSI